VVLDINLLFDGFSFKACRVGASLEKGTNLSLAMAKEMAVDDGPTIYITDQANMVDIMNANINLNHPISRIIACELDWYAFI